MANQEMFIILWNLSGDKKVKAAERNEAIRKVAMWIQNHYPNVYILCQDQINKKKNDYINKKISRRSVVNSEATIYININGAIVETKHLDIAFLYQIHSGIPLDVGNDFTPVRLQAYVLSDSTLIVSWHGPNNKGRGRISNKSKLACFDALITFVEAVKVREKCAIAIVGGDFNIFVNYVREHVQGKPQRYGAAALNLGVYCQYTLTQDRPKNGLLDYVVAWPQTRVTMTENKVLFDAPEVRFIRGGRPFDHNIVHYKLALS